MELRTKGKKRVFLIFARKDRAVSKKIADQFEIEGFKVALFDYELLWGDSLAEKMRNVISSGDYIFVLLSKKSMKSRWLKDELLSTYLDELITRDVTVVPVLTDYSKVPDSLLQLRVFNFQKQTPKNIRKLVDQITSAPKIDFSNFSGRRFERLVADLLAKLHFDHVKIQTGVGDKGIDIKAEYTQKDPFGVKKKETWVVQTKFTPKERASVRVLRELYGILANYENIKALLITNGLLTSVSKRWLENVQRTKKQYIRVIEGPELKNLLLRFPDLVDHYFSPERPTLE